MVHDGHALYEGMTMNEYIDETFDGPPLRPDKLEERERMRVWCRYSENDLGRALMMINWNRIMRSGPMASGNVEDLPSRCRIRTGGAPGCVRAPAQRLPPRSRNPIAASFPA